VQAELAQEQCEKAVKRTKGGGHELACRARSHGNIELKHYLLTSSEKYAIISLYTIG
jgi:hypothetical protein